MNPVELASRIDHTLLRPDATAAEVEALCDEALRFRCAAVCVHGARVALVAQKLRGSPVRTAAVVAFPHGAVPTRHKAFEAQELVAAGAEEIDMVLNLGYLKDGSDEAVTSDVRAVVEAARKPGQSAPAIVKVILEMSLLDAAQKERAARLALAGGAAFLKTSTGFGGGGATVEDVKLLRRIAGSRAQVKASGGIRDRKTALEMLAAGADRLGTSATAKILEG